jgi:Fic family protein
MFTPYFTITSDLVTFLMRIETLLQEIIELPLTPTVLASLRETAMLSSIHYSTMIEGNRLTEEEVALVIAQESHFPGRERDEKEVLGYYVAFDELERVIRLKLPITEKVIQRLHALVMGGGKKRVKPTAYRHGQNVIRESGTRKIVYMPPEAKDVPTLMHALVLWIKKAEKEHLPTPLRAAIAHYQFATIHPYYDGNGRTARLLATLVLHRGGYDLKGIYSLEEYYAKDLSSYYEALAIGPSHNYYLGRAEADVMSWINYFCRGMIESFERVKRQALKAQRDGLKDSSYELKLLDARQRKVLAVFQSVPSITSYDIEKLFKIRPRTARELCKRWVEQGFLVIQSAAKKNRKYELALHFKKLCVSTI